MEINFESLKDLLNVIESKNEFRIQIITREDIKIFKLFLDNSHLDYHINYWNNYLISRNQKIIHVYTSSEDFNPNYKKIILFTPKVDNRFIQFCFKPTYDEKLNFLRSKYKKNDKIDIVLDAYRNSAIHELCDKIENKEMLCMADCFDYTESLILFSMCKKVILFKNSLYKLNISLEALELICKKIDLDIKKI
ncbi:hypothetical protein P3W45_001184 [Vairimorpha bombi]